MAQPYSRLYATLRARAAGTSRATLALTLAVSAALVPLVRPVFMGFLDQPDASVADGLREVWIRASAVALVSMGLAVHGTVLRGEARGVLQLHPVDPVAVVREEVLAAWRGQLPVLLGLCVLLVPLGLSLGWAAWAVGVVLVLGAALASLTTSTVAFLGAVEAAEDPRWAPLLDQIRGNNPRPQAALMYALVPVAIVAGWTSMQAAQAASELWRASTGPSLAAPAFQVGSLLGALLPWAVALVAWPTVPKVAERNWFRASLVLADIRARYESVIDPLEARRVAWDWTLGRLPSPVAREALGVLRYGWRVRRSLLSVGWLLAFAALTVAWREDTVAPVRAGLVAGGAGWVMGLVALQSALSEPAFLVVWLDRASGSRALGAAWAVLCWSSGAVGVATAASLLRHGLVPAASTAGLAAAGVVLAAAFTAWMVARRGGLAPFVATGLLATAGTAAVVLGRVA